ncbi:MAG: hypothetical protein A2096_12860 [Spirochaetes bacterium GWF1_41_5]|nr:MAG: hypothetical protein A2096_12860 [Spirochaetes bacterium GWF1_41_5]HBE04756.1 sugar isomerase [Spirochaetia bacterium]
MKNYQQLYLKEIKRLLEKIESEQGAMLEKAAGIMADQIKADKVIYVFGSGGHSNMMAEELFHRAGGLACFSPIFVDSVRIPHVPMGERCASLATYALDFYGVGKDDLLLLVNGYGINPITIETAIECKKRGVKVIAVTSTDYAKKLPKDFPGRHASGQNLHEMFEVVLQTNMEYGDALIKMDGVSSKVGSYSTFGNAFICNSLVLKCCELLVEDGIEPPVINSINVEGGMEKNKKLYKKYRPLIRWL